MSSVTILLCTHNGADYLPAQLDSIAAQKEVDWALWVSDDASTDATRDMIAAFQDAHPAREIRLLKGAGKGAAANYLALLCHPDLSARRVAFCDQDDVWLPRKLSRAMAALDRFDENSPAAYAAGSLVTDAALNQVGQLHTTGVNLGFQNALVQNVLHGSTLVLNTAAHALLRQAGPAMVPFHDWWCYLVLTACNAPIHLDDEPALLYRQHGDNHIGYNKSIGAGRRRMRLILDGSFRGWLRENGEALMALDLPLPASSRSLIRSFHRMHSRPGPARMLDWGRLGLRRQTRKSTMLLRALAGCGYV